MALTKQIMGTSLMDKSQFVSSSSKSFLSQNQFLVRPSLVPSQRRREHLRKANRGIVAAISEDLVKIVPVFSAEKPVKFKVRAVVTVRNKIKEDFKETISKHVDALTDKIGRNVALELISTEIDPRTKAPKKSSEGVLKDWSKKSSLKAERVNYTAEFMVDSNFGIPGAITVTNKHQKEFFLETITLEDMSAESRVEKPLPMYVPRDEQFEESKMDTFSFGRLKGVLHNLIPSLMSSFKGDKDFRVFGDIDSLYSEGILLKLGLQDELLKKLPLPNMVSKFQDYNQGILKYDTPKILSRTAVQTSSL
ncbi:hypothetical protein GBA52_009503 [Prunus armeniaca]|nr:hypothetical protein GBA52_009503 [Prunus armeniaca]